MSFLPIGVLWRASTCVFCRRQKRVRVEKSLDLAPRFALNRGASQGRRDRYVFE